MGGFCCHGNQSFVSICPKTLCSFSLTPVILHIKFDQDGPTGFRDIKVWKCRRWTTGVLQDHLVSLWLRWAKKVGGLQQGIKVLCYGRWVSDFFLYFIHIGIILSRHWITYWSNCADWMCRISCIFVCISWVILSHVVCKWNCKYMYIRKYPDYCFNETQQ